MKTFELTVGFAVLTSLTACGGGGGGTSIAPPPPEVSVPAATLPTPVVPTPVVTTPTPAVAPIPVAFGLSSTSFVSGEAIANKYTCNGAGTSPQLQWTISSPDVKSFAVVVDDPDAVSVVGHTFVHWNVFNIPADTRQIAEGATGVAMPAGSIEGKNDAGTSKYFGPCPPSGLHHYNFAVYAMNTANPGINTGRSYQRAQFESLYASAIIQKVEILGLYSK